MNEIIPYNEALKALEKATDIKEVADIEAIAIACQKLAKKLKQCIKIQNEWAALRLKAMRKGGKMVKDMEKNIGGRPKKTPDMMSGVSPPTYKERGIEYKQASRWKQIWRIEQQIFDLFLKTFLEDDKKELTTASLLRLVTETPINNKNLPDDKFMVIYADPPWKYGNQMPPHYTLEQGDYYPLMTIQQLCDLPVQDITAKNAVLFIWVTSPILEESFKIINAWGFKYKASFVWDKIKHNMGHYNSVRHEFLLIAIKGSCPLQNKKLFDSVQSIERTKHSEKPNKFRQIIDVIYPKGKRIELFSRKQVKGWESYGNEVRREK